MKKRNSAIDLAKFIASIMIAAIHTGLFSDVNETLYFVVVHIVCRVAVPFFAVCSGYFLASRLEFGETLFRSEYNKDIFLKQWKKLVVLYAVWSVLYLFHSIPMWIEIGWFSPFAFVDYAIGAVTKGSHYHFWYLWGMIYTLPLFYLLLRFCKQRYWVAVIVALWVIKVLSYSYTMLIPSQLADALGKLGSATCLLPLLLLGALIAKQKERMLPCNIVGLMVSVVGLVTEAFALKNHGQEAVSYIVFTLPVAYFLFSLILRVKPAGDGKIASRLGAVSLFIYCVHPMLVELTENVFQNSLIHFVFVAVGSTVLGLGYIDIRKKMKRKKAELCST